MVANNHQISNKKTPKTSKDRQLDHLTKLIDQQQQLQLAIVAENRQLKEHVQKSSGFIGTSRFNKKVQSTENNSIQNKDRNDNQGKKNVPQSGNIQKGTPKNKDHKNWWRFW